MLADIQSRITAAETAAGRPTGSTQLLAVSKVQPNERVADVLAQGHRLFGENKVQEAAGKWPTFQEQYPDASVHLIGPLQTNKVKQAVALFDAIHTVDREKLANKLAAEIQSQGKSPELFIQVNTGEEPQKAGVLPADADAFIATCRGLDLPIIGLMVIPPINEEPSLHFALLRKIAARNGLVGLSMGMSSDFERAIALGATHIRVGSAIFGERDYG
ncbi:YggS family pyridoxal phosphate enzyme [Amylibacter kogurei]|uniref:Pyridoxal phosphate homeostasis protein n=1 Tax=Paramylibacter kogurei TaxID=1889778 RepID=A0A2G5K2X6_9RHOB|nr:YggS family pyridoxal phosphate-dependent enzyme [Amylibacter kogurei]PIB23084.1 YggS family pyridoxal phosphate enzyme [Amylibacter kogurei]